MCQKCTHATVHIISEANKVHIIANHRYRISLGPKDTEKDKEGKQNETKDKKLHSNEEGRLFSKLATRSKVAHVRRRSSATFIAYQQVAVAVPRRHWSKNVLIESLHASQDQAKVRSLPAGNVWISLSNAMCDMSAIRVDAKASQCPLRHLIFDSINCVTSFDAGFESEVRRRIGKTADVVEKIVFPGIQNRLVNS